MGNRPPPGRLPDLRGRGGRTRERRAAGRNPGLDHRDVAGGPRGATCAPHGEQHRQAMKILLCTAAAALVLTPSLLAQGFAPARAAVRAEAPAAETDAKPALPRYELKNKSSFTLTAGARAPFWPIGWVKRKSGAPVEVVNS